MSPNGLANRNLGVHFDAHTEVQIERGRWNLQRASDIALGESVKEVVRRDRVFHHTEIGGAFGEMLALSAGILRSNLLAVDALHGQTLLPCQITDPCHIKCTISYLVFLFGTELDKGSMDIIQRGGRNARGTRFWLWLRSRAGRLLSGSNGGRTCGGRAGGRQRGAAGHALKRSLHRGVRIDAVGHHRPVGGRKGTGTGCGCSRSRNWSIRCCRISIWSADTIGNWLSGLGLRIRGIGMTSETGALGQMLLLARGILRANLLAVDALDREALDKERNAFCQ